MKENLSWQSHFQIQNNKNEFWYSLKRNNYDWIRNSELMPWNILIHADQSFALLTLLVINFRLLYWLAGWLALFTIFEIQCVKMDSAKRIERRKQSIKKELKQRHPKNKNLSLYYLCNKRTIRIYRSFRNKWTITTIKTLSKKSSERVKESTHSLFDQRIKIESILITKHRISPCTDGN